MKHQIYRFFLLLGLVVLSAFTLVPPVHQIPESHKFVPEVVEEKPPLDSVTVMTGSADVIKGEQVCVSLTGYDFNNILSMQFSIGWDTSALKYSHVESFGMRDITNNNFGTKLIEEGKLAFLWYDQHLLGKSQKDGFKLYDICFEAVGEPGTESSVEITRDPTAAEVVNASAVFLSLRGEHGVIKIIEE